LDEKVIVLRSGNKLKTDIKAI